MRLNEAKGAGSQAARFGSHGPDATGETAHESRALVAVAPPGPAHQPPSVHRQAAFLAQLIATKDQHPQTRERRRAAPEEALAAYRVAAALTNRH